MNHVKDDIDAVSEWATGAGESIPSELAVGNAHKIIERVFWSWPQRFDVYPLDGAVAIDSETFERDFIMIICQSDGSISAIADRSGESYRQDYAGQDEGEFEELVASICSWLENLREKRGIDKTSEHNIGYSSTGNSWAGGIDIILPEVHPPVPAREVFSQGIQSILRHAHIGRQTLRRRSSCQNCDKTRQGSQPDLSWMGFSFSECNHQQWPQGFKRPPVQQSISRSYPAPGMPGQGRVRTTPEANGSWGILDREPNIGIGYFGTLSKPLTRRV